MGFGMALAGGGTRGAAHVGVLLALTEAGLIPSSISGASAGAIVAGLYANGLSAQRMKNILLSMSRNSREFIDPDIAGLLRSLAQLLTRRPVTIPGLIKGNRLEKMLCSLTGGKRMSDLSMRTVIPAVDINTGETVAFTNTLRGTLPLPHVRWETDIRVCQAMRASAAVPAVFHPVERGDQCLVDGGLTDNLPVNLLLAAGERNILAVDVSEEYEPPKNHGLIDIASHSLTILTSRLREYLACGEKLLLHPPLPEDAGLLTFEMMGACMEAGYAAAKSEIPVIRAMLG